MTTVTEEVFHNWSAVPTWHEVRAVSRQPGAQGERQVASRGVPRHDDLPRLHPLCQQPIVGVLCVLQDAFKVHLESTRPGGGDS